MIEFCTRKRMVLAIIVLLSLTVVTLIMEGMWSANHKLGEIDSEEEESLCGTEKEKVLEHCQPCSAFEINAEAVYCKKTGYREKVQCGKDKDPAKAKFRSCKVDPWVEEKKFWILELITCVVGFGSYGLVRYRQNKLDKLLMDKVNKQIAA